MGKERLSQVGPSSVITMPLDPDQAATTIQGIYRDRIINGGPGTDHAWKDMLDRVTQVERFG